MVYGAKTTSEQNSPLNESLINKQRKTGLECEQDKAQQTGDDKSKKLKVKINTLEYDFLKYTKPDLTFFTNLYEKTFPENTNKKDRNHTNYECLFFKILMYKANINDGVRLRRVDWTKTTGKDTDIFRFYK